MPRSPTCGPDGPPDGFAAHRRGGAPVNPPVLNGHPALNLARPGSRMVGAMGLSDMSHLSIEQACGLRGELRPRTG